MTETFINSIIFLATWKESSPFRMVLIVLVALLWLLCFSSLFLKDKRKTRVGYRSVFKAKLLKFGFTEKRNHPRIAFPMDVKFRSLYQKSPEQDLFLTGNAKNISETGILINTNEDISLGEDIEIKFNIHGFDKPISIIGNVVRKDKDEIEKTFSLGILFKKVENIDREQLAAFIKKSI